jgi:hypothetical protein
MSNSNESRQNRPLVTPLEVRNQKLELNHFLISGGISIKAKLIRISDLDDLTEYFTTRKRGWVFTDNTEDLIFEILLLEKQGYLD